MTTREEIFSGEELAAIEDTRQSQQERQTQQQDFLDRISQSHEVEVVETELTLWDGDDIDPIRVDVKVALDGELTDRLAEMEDLAETVENSQSVKKASEAVDRSVQMLADMVQDASVDKEFLFLVYRENDGEVIAQMLKNVFEGVEQQRSRDMGEADGFRKQ